MKFKYGFIIIVFVAAVLLQACYSEIPEDDFQGLPDDITDPDEVTDHLALVCEEEGGQWRLFNNGCVDSCDAARNDDIMCTQAMTYGCDCGDDMCWDGQTCVEI